MKLKTKLILLAAVPVTGLALTISTFYFRTNALKEAVHLTTTESVVYADLGRNLQMNVVQVQQFFSDISATRGLDGLDDGFKNAAAQREEFLAGLKRFQEMYESEQDTTHLKEVANLEQTFAGYYRTGQTMAEAYVKDGPAAGNKMMADFDAAASNLTAALGKFVQQQTDELHHSLTAVESSSHRTALAVLFGGLILISGTGVLTFYSIRSIVGPLQKIASQVGENAGSVSASAGELSAASQTVAEGASEQAASLEETSASLEEISSMTKRNAENASNGSELGKQARDSVAAGLNRIADLSHTLDSIKSAVTEMQSAVAETQSSSQEISKIIKTIDEIAFQTNLLALNAAVEAARAGEAGMGFAVVADEVRALAQRSAQAAKDTADKIEAAVKRSELGGVASTKVAKSLTEVEATAESIQQVFTGIVTQIKSLDEVIAEIAAASKEQSQGVNEVNMAVGQMDKVTQSNAAAAEENAASAQEMNTQAKNLQTVIGQLEQLVTGTCADEASATPTTPNRRAKNVPQNRSSRTTSATRAPASHSSLASTTGSIKRAIGAHGAWKRRLYEAIRTGQSDIPPAQAGRDNECEFGKWLHSLPPTERNPVHWEKVRNLHAAFHREAGHILSLALTGKSVEAESHLADGGSYADISAELTDAMKAWEHDCGHASGTALAGDFDIPMPEPMGTQQGIPASAFKDF